MGDGHDHPYTAQNSEITHAWGNHLGQALGTVTDVQLDGPLPEQGCAYNRTGTPHKMLLTVVQILPTLCADEFHDTPASTLWSRL